MGTTFIFLVHFQRLRLSDGLNSCHLLKHLSPPLPVRCFGGGVRESDGKWEGNFPEPIFARFMEVWIRLRTMEHDGGQSGKSGLFSFFCHDFQTYRKVGRRLCIVQGCSRLDDQKGNLFLPPFTDHVQDLT
jgi:hypothetical protein